MNDAIGITLFNTFSSFVGREVTVTLVLEAVLTFIIVFIGSGILGYVTGKKYTTSPQTYICHHRDDVHITTNAGMRNMVDDCAVVDSLH